MSILIKHATILSQNQQRQQIVGDVYIDNGNIIQISTKPLSLEADYKIDGKDKLVLPGLINAHTHIPMTLLRGYGDDMLLNDWLQNKIWPVEARLNKKAIESGTRLGLLEMITTGTTSYVDMYFFEDTIAQVTKKVGLRGFLGFALIDFDTPEYPQSELFTRCEAFLKKWRNDPFITPLVAPHSTYLCNTETLQKSAAIAQKNDALLHTHCSETRDEVYDIQKRYHVRPVGQLKKTGVLNDRMSLAHCGWITKNEITDIKQNGSSVVHCPVSNMKMATGGYAPIPELLDAKVPVGLGTDGAASNNTLNMFETMKFCALIHKHHRWDAMVLPAQTVLDCATLGGARCLRVSDRLGSLEEGKTADLIMIDLKKPHLTPAHDLTSHLVYATQGSDVCTTIVNGTPLMLDYKLLTMDVDKTLEDAQRCALELTS